MKRIDEVYPGGFTIPVGFRATEFRVPNRNENYLVSTSGSSVGIVDTYIPAGPRFILIPENVRETIEFNGTANQLKDLKAYAVARGITLIVHLTIKK